MSTTSLPSMPSPSLSDFTIINNGLEFKQMSNGHIYCQVCDNNTLWCSHIEDVIKDNADSSALLGRMPFEGDIPIFPSENYWQHVLIEPHEKHERMFAVRMVNEDPVTEEFLGYITDGEGRGVIRSMILDRFVAKRLAFDLQCASASHKFNAEMVWQKNEKDEQASLIQDWSVYKTGMCPHCTIGGSAFDPDLVPNDKKPSVWS